MHNDLLDLIYIYIKVVRSVICELLNKPNQAKFFMIFTPLYSLILIEDQMLVFDHNVVVFFIIDRVLLGPKKHTQKINYDFEESS